MPITQSFLVRKNAQSRNGWHIKKQEVENMLQIVDKDEVAERKPYKFGYEAVTKMLMRKKQKQIKKMKIANSIVKINSLVEAIIKTAIGEIINVIKTANNNNVGYI